MVRIKRMRERERERERERDQTRRKYRTPGSTESSPMACGATNRSLLEADCFSRTTGTRHARANKLEWLPPGSLPGTIGIRAIGEIRFERSPCNNTPVAPPPPPRPSRVLSPISILLSLSDSVPNHIPPRLLSSLIPHRRKTVASTLPDCLTDTMITRSESFARNPSLTRYCNVKIEFSLYITLRCRW